MANRLEISWGGITTGKLSRNPMPLNEAICGENVTITNFSSVSNSYPTTSMRQGFTEFRCSAQSDSYAYVSWNGGILALKPSTWGLGTFQSIFVDKGNPPESFSYVICASMSAVNIPNLVDVVGELFKDSSGQYFDKDGNVISFPSGVTLSVGSVPNTYLGSDGNLYNNDGSLSDFNPNLTYTQYIDTFKGSDGNFYNSEGQQIFEDIPSDIVPIGKLGDAYLFNDNNYYKDDGNLAFTNLPSGVTIESYDSVTGDYIGSDGKSYDIDGNEAVHCNGDLLQYSNSVRIVIDATDIFGNQLNIGSDVVIGVDNVIHAPQGALIKQINRIVVRNMTTSASCGFGNIRIYGDIVGAKIGLDLEGVDIDAVLGSYEVASCVFQACNQYADIVYNPNLPLGFTNLTALDSGYYCMTSDIRLTFEGFDSSEFPYCCPSYDDTEKHGGELGKTDDKIEVSDDCSCEYLEQIHLTLSDKLDGIIDKLDGLMCICDKLDSLVTAITNKDFTITVSPEITVEPSDVTVTNPVNNITVEPCSPVVTVTNPVNNVTVQSAVPDITVAPCQPTIQNVINEGDVNVDTDSLVDKLDELFKKDEDTITDIVDEALHVTYQNYKGEMVTESITEVIKNKEDTNVFECIVEPVNMAYEGYGKYVSKELLDENGN